MAPSSRDWTRCVWASFVGDSTGLEGVEADLAACVAQRQQAPLQARTGFPWLVALVMLTVVLLAGAWGIHWWLGERRWEDYVARLRAQPGIVITETGRHDGKYLVEGLRDPLAVDPKTIDYCVLTHAHLDHTGWLPRFVKSGFHGPIFANPATLELTSPCSPA